jgi:hypothetical protein
MGVGEGDGHGVSSVDSGFFLETQKLDHHIVDLLFFRSAVADNGGLHLGGTVGNDLDVESSENGENDAPTFGKCEPTLRVEPGKRGLDGSTVGIEIGDHGNEALLEIGEPGVATGASGPHHPSGFEPIPVAFGHHERPAGGPGTRIDAENTDNHDLAGSLLRHHIVVDIEVCPHVLNIVVIVERVHQADHLLGRFSLEASCA